MIQLSLRYQRDDHFWFSFFHEACHLLRHPKKPVYVDYLPERIESVEDEMEQEANSFAARVLIPQQYESRLSELSTLMDVIEFAEQLGVAPGIVLGQLHHRNLHSWSWGNQLRARVRLPRGSESSGESR